MGNIIGRKDSKETPKLFTPWSLAHLVGGMFLYGLLVEIIPGSNSEKYSVFICMVLHTLYEIKDYWYTYFNKPLPNPIHKLVILIYKLSSNKVQGSKLKIDDTLLNSIGDTLSCCLGIYLYHKYNFNLKNITVIYILMIIKFCHFNLD